MVLHSGIRPRSPKKRYLNQRIIHSATRSPLQGFLIELPNSISLSCEGVESRVIRGASRSLCGFIETLQL